MEVTDDGLGELGAIDAALLEYFEERSPFVAIMLEGAWGSGKTHFLRERGERLVARAGKKYVSLSVAGLGSREDLEQALFFAATPILKNGYAEALGIFTRAAMRWAKIDPDDLKPSADLSSGSVVVVLDDIERFAGDFKVLFGFVVDLVDSNGLHVVVVASEQKLVEGALVGEWKEKVVGRTIRVLPDANVMIDATLGALSNRSVAEKLAACRSGLLNVLNKSELSSFRAVKHSLREISKVVESLGDEFDELQSAQTVLVEGLLIGLLETKRDASKTKEIASLFAHADLGIAYQAVALQRPDESEAVDSESVVEKVLMRYEGTNLLLFPGGRAFSDFFSKGITDASAMVSLFDGLKRQAHEEVAPSVLNSNVFELEQEEFEQQAADLEQSIRKRELRSLAMVARIYVAMKYWSQRRLIAVSPEDITKICVAAIDHMPPGEVLDRNADTDVFWFQRRLDEGDEAIARAIKDKVAAAYESDVERSREEVRRMLSSSSQKLAGLEEDWALKPLFVGNANQWVTALEGASASQLQEFLGLLGRRSRIGGAEQYLDAEQPYLRLIADGLARSIPETGRLTLKQSQLLSLVRAFRSRADVVERSQVVAWSAASEISDDEI